tara:strand:+ start:420 stop:812 length:393 start_codon:yes stop_codon:yes gene_type:complete
MKIKNLENKYLIYLILLFFFTIHFKFFENIYIVSRSSYEQRLISNYGYCEKNSYGFIKYIQSKYKLKKNIYIFNDESYPLSDSFIYKLKKDFLQDKIILLNYNEQDSKININDYLIIEKFKNCYFLKKND